jgi:acetylornithine deacetylase
MSQELPGLEIDHDRCLDLLRELIAIPSSSGQEEQAAAFVGANLRATGAEVVDVPPANVLARIEGGQPGPARLFLTHSDTMVPGGMEKPYVPAIVSVPGEDGDEPAIRGLGAAAPKSAVAAMMAAFEAVARRPSELAGSVTLAVVTKDLQANHAGVREVLAAVDLQADFVVAGEPAGNHVVVGARGILGLRIDIEGRPAHWGRPNDAANPLYAVANLLERIRTLDLPTDPNLGSATVSPFEVTTEFSAPQSPHHATLRLDRRVLPDEDADALVEEFRAIAEEACSPIDGLSWSLTPERTMYPLSIAADDPLVRALRGAIESATGIAREPRHITFSSNAGIMLAQRGVPSVGFGPGEITDLGPDEHVRLSQLREATTAFGAMMRADLP